MPASLPVVQTGISRMLPSNRSFAFLVAGLLLAGPCFTARADQPAAPAPVAHPHKAHKKQAPLVLPPLPAGPLRQVPLDQLPASEPKVTYENGLLSISAQNSTLGEILRDVRQLTGASIEIPLGGTSERVVTQLGPGAPRDVLALLLNGTAFNYVMLGSTSDPNAVASIVLTPTPSSSSGESQTVANAAPAPQPQPMMPGNPALGNLLPNHGGGGQANARPTAGTPEDDNSDDADDDKDDDSDQTAQPVQPGGAVVTPPTNPDDQSGNPPNAGPRTPEQILEMLRRGQTPPGAPPGFVPPSLPQQPPQQ